MELFSSIEHDWWDERFSYLEEFKDFRDRLNYLEQFCGKAQITVVEDIRQPSSIKPVALFETGELVQNEEGRLVRSDQSTLLVVDHIRKNRVFSIFQNQAIETEDPDMFGFRSQVTHVYENGIMDMHFDSGVEYFHSNNTGAEIVEAGMSGPYIDAKLVNNRPNIYITSRLPQCTQIKPDSKLASVSVMDVTSAELIEWKQEIETIMPLMKQLDEHHFKFPTRIIND